MFDLLTITMLLFFGLIFGSSLIKAKYHFDYLKIIQPKEYGDYPSYFSVFTPKYYSVILQFLILPFFNRKKELENEHSAKLAAKVKKILFIHLFFILSMAVFVGVLFYNSDA